MAQRGKQSAAAIAVHPLSIEVVQRPDAPYDLTDEETDEWRAIVSRMPAEWFPRETHGVLSQLCRHIVNARRVAQLIVDALKIPKKLDLGAYDKLLKMQERESRAIASLSTKLRITQQTTYDKSKKKPTLVAKPWELNE